MINTANKVSPLTCPKCGQNKNKIRADSTAYVEEIIYRNEFGNIQVSGQPAIYTQGGKENKLYMCVECGYSSGDIRYFIPEQKADAEEATKQWWKEQPNGCC